MGWGKGTAPFKVLSENYYLSFFDEVQLCPQGAAQTQQMRQKRESWSNSTLLIFLITQFFSVVAHSVYGPYVSSLL